MLSVSVAALLALSSFALAADEEPPEDGFGMGALPALNYNSDEGFGYGVIGTGYWYRDGLRPYKYGLTLRVFLTTKNVHAHMVRLDALDVADLPLRVTAQAGYYSTLAANFCGYVGDGHCGADSESVAEAAAETAGLTGTEREDFLRRYYLHRYTEPYLNVQTRIRLKDLPHKVEIMAGYRGSYYMQGTPSDQNPWPGSLYDTAYFATGELAGNDDGFASVLQAGMVFDNRDNEPAPNSGYWSEFSMRGAGAFSGSAWSFGGINVTHRQYQTLIDKWLVSASRLVGDTAFGELPTQEMVRMGGLVDYSAVGGQSGGRGLRQWRLIGNTKLLVQEELRLTFARLTPGKQKVDLGTVAFLDYGLVAPSLSEFDQFETGYGTGGGLRVTWNTNFIVRVDAGFSPVENWANKLYINLDHIF
ncbi:MAG: hypothetical protein CL927_14605 [Deltaproteobacteria bacterium]|nr:hypothetical protein [Deltaproteobacteria bacterium]